MKNNAIQDFLHTLRIPFLGEDLMHKYEDEKPPLRAELFSLEQMEQYARNLAGTQVTAKENEPEQLLKRLAANEEVLLEVHNLLTESLKENSRIMPAGEWLLDNFYLIEEQVYTGKKHLPKGYSKGLPQLEKGASAGLPRVYDIALEIVSHSDGRIDLDSLTRFVNAYQEISNLKLGELWAIPIMLRLALIENLRRLAANIARDRISKNLADYWADKLTETSEKDPANLVIVIADMARYGPPLVSSFVAELTRRLSGKGASLALALSWIEQRLSENGQTSNELVYQENQKQAADQVSMSNTIGSLRFLGSNNWREFVEAISLVEKTLETDPAGVYKRMDFHTRDQYRHEVERISKSGKYSELEVAEMAIRLSLQKKQEDGKERTAHVGFFLVGKGLDQLEKSAGVTFSFFARVKRFGDRHPLFSYQGTITLLTFFTGFLLWLRVYPAGTDLRLLIPVSIVLVVVVSQPVIALVNWLSTLLTKPGLLPRMDFSEGITPASRTLVTVPCLFNSTAAFDKLIEDLEVRFLANRDPELFFSLLTDFPDAAQEHLSGDEELLAHAKQKTDSLNMFYGRSDHPVFFTFHRYRKWNRREKTWMGYERKRGKLGDLNALLRGTGKERFALITGDTADLEKVKYVITLDADTDLPKDAAWKITGTLAHPLNVAGYDEKKQRITEGYSILQPRVAVSLPESNSSLYKRIHGNEPGMDPYTRAISDVYQDLFGEGSFIGKGIYDVDAFEKVLQNRFPENRILSHDLLEGSYARCGLISDVQLYESYPSGYLADIRRRERWTRGDWQIAGWLLPWVPGSKKKYLKNPISALSRWKITDNLRRSLYPPSMVLLLLYGWFFSSSPLFWTITAIVIIVIPSAIRFLYDLLKKPEDILFRSHLYVSVHAARDQFLQHFLTVTNMCYEAWVYCASILRTGWRMLITKRKLLEWNPSTFAPADDSEPGSFFVRMWVSPVLAVLIYILLVWYAPSSIFTALPFLALWALAPAITWRFSYPHPDREADLSPDQDKFLRAVARKTWSFFEQFVSLEDNWLPPDNYQEKPVERIAHRTSPTNIGLSLLANLSAYDFGYLSAGQLLERTTNAITTLYGMERYRGHFYNWYDTRTLRPLLPVYISSVDSGNLAGHLLTLKHGLLELPDRKICSPQLFAGLCDTANVLMEKMHPPDFPISLITDLESACSSPPVITETAILYLDRTLMIAAQIVYSLQSQTESEATWWANSLHTQCLQARDELTLFAPWTDGSAVPEEFANIHYLTAGIPTFREVSVLDETLHVLLREINRDTLAPESSAWLNRFNKQVAEAVQRAKERILLFHTLATHCDDCANMEFDFLLDKSKRLLSIGFHVDEQRLDLSFYDLLASECRLTTFVGIAQGKLPQSSWFALGRQLTHAGVAPALLSWSGSMFEYLMPLLVMPTYENTLLDQTNKSAVQKQIDYGKKRNVPWGISESGYYMFDANLNYQYRAFGIPGLGLKRGLGEDLVIAPYACMMALMVAPEDACKNLEKLATQGIIGKYGFYEAIDYTATRLVRGQPQAIIQSFMVHHQGMGLLALNYLLNNRPMQRRFESEPAFKSVLLLLQERIPHVTEYFSPPVHVSEMGFATQETPIRVITTANTAFPEVQLLSNGRYHVMVTNSGGGFSKWKDLAVTRWREDTTLDNRGAFCYLRDLEDNLLWSTAWQPTLKQPENYEVVFSQGRAEFRRRDNGLETHTEIVVSSEDDVEMRRITLVNRSKRKRYIEITSYAEVVLAPAISDALHPAFSNLFVETEIIPARHAILCTRRPRSADERIPWMFHLVNVHRADIRSITYETDRNIFIGRGNSLVNPGALQSAKPLQNHEGAVLDPVVAIQYRILIEPQETAVIDMVTGMGETRDSCTGLIEKYQDSPMTSRAFELAWTHGQVLLRQIDASEADAQLYNRMAGSVIYSNASLRADAKIIVKNRRSQSALWSYSISGDYPIVLLQVENAENIDLVKQMVQAHAYWRLKGIVVDLVIWNEDHGVYRQALQNRINDLIGSGITQDMKDRPGGIFIRSGEQIAFEDRILFQTLARIIISDTQGSLDEQVNARTKVKISLPLLSPTKFYPTIQSEIDIPENLRFFNGTGGFSENGKEYVIITGKNKRTPVPWINVLANPHFGCIVSESGQSYTWVENAHEFRLTPWNNDAVNDLEGEAFFIRDEESGKYWSPTPLPAEGKNNYLARHGFGYSIFEFREDGIYSELTMHVDMLDPVKFISVKIRNNSGRTRKLSVTGYMEWVLGDLRPKNMMHVITETEPATGTLLVKNNYNKEWQNRTVFFDTDEQVKSITCDRLEFIGRNGTLAKPDALTRAKLSGKTGAGLDPCGAIQVIVELADSEERDILFRVGAGDEFSDLVSLIKKHRGSGAWERSITQVKNYWEKTLSTVRIKTPDEALDMLANGWLTYQTICCRVWARSGFYQSGGAFGFRDQLQDVLSLLIMEPALARKQILLHASRQFREGDVQHWWHPPQGRGVRTTCSDDYLWLPYAISRYIDCTGDNAILDENISFLEGRPLNPAEESYYDLPSVAEQKATLFTHGCIAVERALVFGEHGLPLMGSGDWNDGMDKVGTHGKGESVWLAFFLYEVLNKFTTVASLKGDAVRVSNYREQAAQLKKNIEANTWDGNWYRRAYFDDGTPLGSAVNEECKIDSISQSWSVLSGAAAPGRASQAMHAAADALVRKDTGIIQLFDPPFDKSALNPGYIKGYVPGVRENGGQYTHAAIWMVMAFAKLGEKERTWDLLRMINPVSHGQTAEQVATYGAEPYVVAADVYALKNHIGRAGWTWYTGSAGWMNQLITGSILGINKSGDRMCFTPCVPAAWKTFTIFYRYLDTQYTFNFFQAEEGATQNLLRENGEGEFVPELTLINDGALHEVEIRFI